MWGHIQQCVCCLQEVQSCSIPLSLHLEVEWTKYGSLVNSQPQIVSITEIIQTNTTSLVRFTFSQRNERGNLKKVIFQSTLPCLSVFFSCRPCYLAAAASCRSERQWPSYQCLLLRFLVTEQLPPSMLNYPMISSFLLSDPTATPQFIQAPITSVWEDFPYTLVQDIYDSKNCLCDQFITVHCE